MVSRFCLGFGTSALKHKISLQSARPNSDHLLARVRIGILDAEVKAAGRPLVVMMIETDGAHIHSIFAIANSDKLTAPAGN